MNDEVEFVKPKDKKCNRRSSFFRRLSSFNSDSPTGIRATSPAQVKGAAAQEKSLTEYQGKLQKEIEDWEDLEYQKKKQEDQSKKSCRAVSSVDFLTAEDKKFLEDRPDYVAIGRLLDNVAEAVAIKRCRINNSVERVNSFVKKCEQISNELAVDVIDYFMEGFDELCDVAPAS